MIALSWSNVVQAVCFVLAAFLLKLYYGGKAAYILRIVPRYYLLAFSVFLFGFGFFVTL